MTRTACKKLRYLEKKNLSAVVRMIVTASAAATCAEETLAEETAIHSEWNCADRGWWKPRRIAHHAHSHQLPRHEDGHPNDIGQAPRHHLTRNICIHGPPRCLWPRLTVARERELSASNFRDPIDRVADRLITAVEDNGVGYVANHHGIHAMPKAQWSSGCQNSPHH